MIILLSISLLLIIAYLIYPVYLLVFFRTGNEKSHETVPFEGVSLILFSYNGRQYLEEKINFLRNELKQFPESELIIIDDHSTDGSVEALDHMSGVENVRVQLKEIQSGIANSMNTAVEMAKYNFIIFCDQRQQLVSGNLQKIVAPLKFKNVGAVSGCISPIDKSHHYSVLRRHENYIKGAESLSGNLMGVYGPFYAFKKQCYSPIPEDIILDDLYLSLCILKDKDIVLRQDCIITDENFSILYNYDRTRRYLKGFLQILEKRNVLGNLARQQRIMLLWHKYLRLLIPVFLFFTFIMSAVMVKQGDLYVFIFSLFVLSGIIALLPVKIKMITRWKNILRMNMLYLLAFGDLTIKVLQMLFKSKSKQRPANTQAFGN